MLNVSREQVEKDLLKVIAKLGGTSPDKLKLDNTLREDLGFDSLKAMEAVSRITELYNIDPDVNDLADIKTIRDILDYLMKQVGK